MPKSQDKKPTRSCLVRKLKTASRWDTTHLLSLPTTKSPITIVGYVNPPHRQQRSSNAGAVAASPPPERRSNNNDNQNDRQTVGATSRRGASFRPGERRGRSRSRIGKRRNRQQDESEKELAQAEKGDTEELGGGSHGVAALKRNA
jgi:hypothetical protein